MKLIDLIEILQKLEKTGNMRYIDVVADIDGEIADLEDVSVLRFDDKNVVVFHIDTEQQDDIDRRQSFGDSKFNGRM